MPARSVLMLVGDYVEDYEVIVPFQMLEIVGPKGVANARLNVALQIA